MSKENFANKIGAIPLELGNFEIENYKDIIPLWEEKFTRRKINNKYCFTQKHLLKWILTGSTVVLVVAYLHYILQVMNPKLNTTQAPSTNSAQVKGIPELEISPILSTATLASTLASLLRTTERLFDNIKFLEDTPLFGFGSSIEENIEILQSLLKDPDVLSTLFGNYKKIHRFENIKEYEDDDRHMNQFLKNVLAILHHNLDSKKSFLKSINQLTDMDLEEVIRYYTGFKPTTANSTIDLARSSYEIPDPPSSAKTEKEESFNNQSGTKMSHIPNSKDWREQGIVTSVKNQYTCGSCVLFAAAGALESSWVLWHGGSLFDLSEQQLLDCIPFGEEHLGCGGNDMESTFSFMQSHGSGLDDLYPYQNYRWKCINIPTVAKVKDFFPLPQDENEMKSYLYLFGPITVTIHVNEDFQQYSSGIFTSGNCDGKMNHAVLVVGYGTDDGQDYWIVKNSWGTEWGENGYIRILRNKNMCSIAMNSFMITT